MVRVFAAGWGGLMSCCFFVVRDSEQRDIPSLPTCGANDLQCTKISEIHW